MSMQVLEFSAGKMAQGHGVALVTVTEVYGSSPASRGQMMAVLDDGTTMGTVGGGASEFHIRRLAEEAIRQGKEVFEFSFDHSEDGMVCGGGMKGYGTVVGCAPSLVVFGGGHISQALAYVALAAGFSVCVVEDRQELESSFPSEIAFKLLEPDGYAGALHLDAHSYAVICTRGHRTDDAALRFCLAQSPAYIGMIGSRKKVSALMAGLERDNVLAEKRASIYTPIGLDIASEKPGEISVAIMAEIISVKNGGTLRHKRDAPRP